MILEKIREAMQINNKDYDLVIKRLYLYYDMKLVTFGINDQRNLIVQFPVFVHPTYPATTYIVTNENSSNCR